MLLDCLCSLNCILRFGFGIVDSLSRSSSFLSASEHIEGNCTHFILIHLISMDSTFPVFHKLELYTIFGKLPVKIQIQPVIDVQNGKG